MKKTLLLMCAMINLVVDAKTETWKLTTTMTATLDDAGTLLVVGTGNMPDWNSKYSVPWCGRTIQKVVVADGVTSIGDRAFKDQAPLKSVEMSCSVTNIGWYAFAGCNFTNITIPSSVFSIGGYAFADCKRLTNVNIPAGVTEIAYYAFSGCSALQGVEIPPSVVSIGSGAFVLCSSLMSVEIPSSVTIVGEEAFHGCSGLTNLTISTGVKNIENFAFSGCASLQKVTVPHSVLKLGENAFWVCTALNEVDFEGLPPYGLGKSCIKVDAKIRYNQVYENDWLNTEKSLGLMNATPYDPFPVEISNVRARQRYPWNGKVDISFFTRNLDYKTKVLGSPMKLTVLSIDQSTFVTNVASAVAGDINLTEGNHTIVWDMDAQGLQLKSTNVVFKVIFQPTSARYCIIDLSAGANAEMYPVTYMNKIPNGNWGDEYKTSKLVLQRIDPGSCVVTIDDPYYIGVYETTQRQYELVMGSNPSRHIGPKLPVENISYDRLRAGEPSSAYVAEGCFVEILRSRTGLLIDLPQDSQWEYACRSGSTNYYCYGNVPNGSYMWYTDNSGNVSHEVGECLPNKYGLYDMHGNIAEMCRDWYDYPGSGLSCRGGSYGSFASLCSSETRSHMDHAEYDAFSGFRVCGNVYQYHEQNNSKQAGISYEGASEAVKIDLDAGMRRAHLVESLAFSTDWVLCAGESALAKIAISGNILSEKPGSGLVEWTPDSNGVFELTHTVSTNGVPVGEVLSATFLVEGLTPKAPIIMPASGTIFDSSLTITMTCASDGAIIHYTTDGTTPTMESPIYTKKFRIYEKTIVKAIAFDEDGTPSEMAVAEYAMGQCENPVIRPSDGSVFQHSGQRVSIAWEETNGALRVTTDGSEPTKESPEYEGPFTIDETTTIKAKVFSDTWFDSEVVTAALTREWVKVATPVITADETFTGTKNKVVMSCANEGATIHYTLDGSEPTTSSLVYSKPFCVTEGCTIKAKAVQYDYTDSDVAEKEITREWGIGQTMGKPDHSFETSGDAGFVRVVDETAALGESMRSGEIKNSQTSILSTVVVGPGKLSFKWKTSCEYDEELHEWDHAEFVLDGDILEVLDGETNWQSVSCDITGDGPHTVIWRYVKDESEFEGEDCLWVSEYVWESDYTETQTTGVSVPYLWLEEKCSDVVDEFESYEKVAKQKALNKRLTVEQCYVAGVDPESLTQDFTTTITMEGGFPTVTWDPDLGVLREYKVWGKASLVGGDWVCPTNSTHRFFKVTVEMP